MATPRRISRISNSLRKLIHPDLFQAASPTVKSTNLKALTTLNSLIGSLGTLQTTAQSGDRANGRAPLRLDFFVRSSSSGFLSKTVKVNPSRFQDEAGMFSELKRIHGVATGDVSEAKESASTIGREDQDKVYGTSLRSPDAAQRRKMKASKRLSRAEVAEINASLDGEYLKMKEAYSLGLHVGKFGGRNEADIINGSVERIVGSTVKRAGGGSVVGSIVKAEVKEKIRNFLVAVLGLSLREYNYLTSRKHDSTLFDLLKRDGLKYSLFDGMQFEILEDGWDLMGLEELDLMEGELEWIGYGYEYRTRSIVDHEHKGEKEEKSDVYHKVFNDKGGNRRERVLVVSVMEDFEEGRLLCLLDEALRD
ncbi:hypothetical protein TrST_g9438 [Triparma strigata]|uniref:DUF4460 domain-containing protein n=1 Tax=Triparma strigata TaxID=1606541 RepID=A0A9W7AQU9_9STRA|nr:hypothetical protein TrST_g9438 [Triparma strigata]